MVENQQQSFQAQISKPDIFKRLFFISIFVLLISNSLLIYKNSVNLKNIKNQETVCPTIACPTVAPPAPTQIPVPTLIPISPPKMPPTTYVCPSSPWVDCMPKVDEPQNYQCQKAFLTWAKAHCPGFKGAAL